MEVSLHILQIRCDTATIIQIHIHLGIEHWILGIGAPICSFVVVVVFIVVEIDEKIDDDR